MKKKEIAVVAVILIAALTLWFVLRPASSSNLEVHVYLHDELVDTVDLTTDKTYTYEGDTGTFHLEVKDGKYRAVDVDCPNQICVNVGWVSPEDETSIICAPNGITVVAESAE